MLVAEETALAENFTQSLVLMRDIGSILTTLESRLRASEVDNIDELLRGLEAKQRTSEELSEKRRRLLPERDSYSSCLNLFRPESRRHIAQTVDALQVTLATIRRQQERVWILMTVRATVVDRTLRILTGGSAEAYDASGRMSVSTAQPVLKQHRC